MEKHQCKLCLRNFSNGRALGGHMRSHVMNLYVKSNPNKNQTQFSEEETESLPSSSSSSSSSEEEEEIETNRGLISNGVLEKFKFRKRNWLSSMEPNDQFSAVLQGDRESETESSKKSSSFRRSKRIRRSRISEFSNVKQEEEPNRGKSPIESEFSPLLLDQEPEESSISDITPEEDVAYCLMMLSRDKWNEESEEFGGKKGKKQNRNRGKYRCETCKKGFRSYQALGGHRASHKRSKVSEEQESSSMVETNNNNEEEEEKKKVHKCPVCFRIFSSGQALGGHKRTHGLIINQSAAMAAAAAANNNNRPFSRIGRETLIDLNLPAPMEDELSAVSDDEFLNYNRH
ncbi:hypothetical protein M9H77_33403 [Catharanthus roseus]|uniref:Uncharacterized protein n=1 Tax=Catharanthus roseus TaxID=4058 RepID=A0ACB9ZJ25_CATRO|nr:hypothetical protein M9H77_33403 [Catharanthus roseus]